MKTIVCRTAKGSVEYKNIEEGAYTGLSVSKDEKGDIIIKVNFITEYNTADNICIRVINPSPYPPVNEVVEYLEEFFSNHSQKRIDLTYSYSIQLA